MTTKIGHFRLFLKQANRTILRTALCVPTNS